MDALSDVLRVIRLSGGIFLEAHMTAPWCFKGRLSPDDCKAYQVAPALVIAFHYVASGRMLVQVEGEAPIEVHAGEIILLPRNDPHSLASAAGLNPVQVTELIQPSPNGGPPQIVDGPMCDPESCTADALANRTRVAGADE